MLSVGREDGRHVLSLILPPQAATPTRRPPFGLIQVSHGVGKTQTRRGAPSPSPCQACRPRSCPLGASAHSRRANRVAASRRLPSSPLPPLPCPLSSCTASYVEGRSWPPTIPPCPHSAEHLGDCRQPPTHSNGLCPSPAHDWKHCMRPPRHRRWASLLAGLPRGQR